MGAGTITPRNTGGSKTRIAVIGGGPIGLEAALHARAGGHDAVLYERGDVAANVGAWGFLQMFTPWRMNTTPLGRRTAGDRPLFNSDRCPTGGEFRDDYLAPVAESELLEGVVQSHTRVTAVGRERATAGGPGGAGAPAAPAAGPFRLLVCDRFGVEQVDHADVVLDCSGTYGNPRWAGRGEMPAMGEFGLKDRLWYTVPDVLGADRERFADRHTLLLGAGTSAATILVQLGRLAADCPGTRVTWAFRRWGQVLQLAADDPLPVRRALVEQVLRYSAAPPPWLELLEAAEVERVAAVQGLWVTLRRGSQDVSRRVDEIVTAVGYRPDESIFEPLRARPAYTSARAAVLSPDDPDEAVPAAGGRAGDLEPDTALSPVPGFYILGAKSFGTNSNFLLRTGHRQVHDAFRAIDAAGRPA